MSQEVKQLFAQEITQDESQISLARAALHLAQYLGQRFEPAIYLTQLAEWAQALHSQLAGTEPGVEQITCLNRYLFDDLGFAGNIANYYHPNNSFLNQVIDSRTGIPISLSLIYLEIGQRLDLPLWGIGMPGHFIVGYGSPDQPLYIDVFNQGRLLSEADCQALVQPSPPPDQSFREAFLQPVDKQAILLRMLRNLKQIYLNWEDWAACYRVVDLMLVIQPAEATELRDRGLLANRLGRRHEALFDLKRYLFLAPKSQESAWIEQRIEQIEEELLRLN